MSEDGDGNFLQLCDFVTRAGARAWFKIECDALSDETVAAFAEVIRRHAAQFHVVYGVPRGGLRLAAALRRHITTPLANARVLTALLVDDVWTTGGAMREWETVVRADHSRDVVVLRKAVMFARRPPDDGTHAVFTWTGGT